MKVKDVISTPEWDFVCIETEFNSNPDLGAIMRIIGKRVGYCVVDGRNGGCVDIFLKRNIPPNTMRSIFDDLAKFDEDTMINKSLANEMNVEEIKNTLKKFMV